MLGREARIPLLALESYSEAPIFNTKAVVHQTGVPAPTLRAWERRYGILTPHRGSNDYRLYSERDMAVIGWLRQRVSSGMTISQAVALLRAYERAHQRAAQAPVAERAAATGPVTAPPEAALSLPRLAEALLDHLLGLREEGAQRIMAQALAVHALEDVCLSLCTPVLERVGQLWEAGQVSIAHEHFSAAVIRTQLEALFRSAAPLETGPCALVGCVPDELHEIGALMLALFLRRQGLHVIYLGQTVEAESLARMARETEAACVALSAALEEHLGALADVGQRLLAEAGQRTVLFVGGRALRQQPALAQRLPGVPLTLGAHEAAVEIYRRCMS